MASLVVETTEGVALSHEIAGPGSRGAAALVDLVLWLTGLAVAFLALLVAQSVDPTGVSAFVLGLVIGGTLLSQVLYQVVFALAWDGQTPGKRLLGIRVRDQEGRPATLTQHVLRGLFFPFEAWPIVPPSLGLLLMAATPRSQRLGDLVAGTLVLRDSEADAVGEPFARERWSELPQRRLALTPALAARLDGEDLHYLRRLVTRHGLDPAARRRLLVDSARHYAAVLGIELDRPSEGEARDVLREVYLFLRESRGRQASGG